MCSNIIMQILLNVVFVGKLLILKIVKGKYNGLPSEEISNMIIEYSQEKGIVIDTYDITSTVEAS